MDFSANLGFLFADLPFVERITAAAAAGFGAVEFHDQAQHGDIAAIERRLTDAHLVLCSLNCGGGESFGLAARPGAEAAFRAEFDQALAAAQRLSARAIHLLCGITSGPEAGTSLRRNLDYALARSDRMLLLEPICPQAVPGYYLCHPEQAQDLLALYDHPHLRIMADWYHFAQIFGSDGVALAKLRALAGQLGHLQLARGDDRGDPFAAQLPAWPGLRQIALAHGLTIGLEYRAQAAPAAVLASLRQGQL